MLTGSVAATLIGLIFVSVSLHIDVIASARKDSDIRAMARQTFGNFLLIISFALVYLAIEIMKGDTSAELKRDLHSSGS